MWPPGTNPYQGLGTVNAWVLSMTGLCQVTLSQSFAGTSLSIDESAVNQVRVWSSSGSHDMAADRLCDRDIWSPVAGKKPPPASSWRTGGKTRSSTSTLALLCAAVTFATCTALAASHPQSLEHLFHSQGHHADHARAVRRAWLNEADPHGRIHGDRRCGFEAIFGNQTCTHR